MKASGLPKLGSYAQPTPSANHYVVYASKYVATEDCMKPSWEVWNQMRKSIYVQVDDNVCKRRLIENENL
jgi:hypothetical protein